MVGDALAEIHFLLRTASERDDIAALALNEVVCLNLLGQKEEGWRRLKELQETLPESDAFTPGAGFLEVCYFSESGHYQDALNRIEELFSKYRKTFEDADNRDFYEGLQAHRGIALVALDRETEAKPILKEAVAFPKYRARIDHFLGVCHYRLDEFESAKEHLAEAFQLGCPAELVAASHYYLGLTHFQLGVFARAKQELEKALSTAGNDDQLRKFAQDWLARTNQAMRGSYTGS
jgi:tetratricopeptide (TPR) repeat protein